MCMTSPSEDGQNPRRAFPIIKTEEVLPQSGKDPRSSSENSTTSRDDNHDIIEFGPLKIKQRKKPAPTLATGRRSKYEMLSPEEEQKRNVRRERNRAAAERVRLSRLHIEQQLQDQIDTLEDEEETLLGNLQRLQHRKLNLETRLFTHDKLCSSITTTNPPPAHLMSAFTIANPPVFPIVEQVSAFYLEELFAEPPPPIENNYSNSSAILTTDDIDDFIMNL